MKNLESKFENLKSSWEGLAETEKNLLDLKSGTKITGLSTEVKNWIKSKYESISKSLGYGSSVGNMEVEKGSIENSKGKFEYKNESKDKEYDIYLYTIKNRGRPKDVAKQAVKQGIAKKKEGILVTDAKGNVYDKNHRFVAGNEVYVKVPKNTVSKPAGNSGSTVVESTNTSSRRTVNGGRSNLESKESSNKQVVSEQWMYDKCIEYGVTDKRQIAYILATAKREAPNIGGHGFKNQPEIGRGKGKKYGKVDPSTGHIYYGRGFVQLTHKENYITLTKDIRSSGRNFRTNDGKIIKGSDVDLVHNPDIILQSNDLAAFITIFGMKHGRFTRVGLDKYINKNKTDYVGARKIVNGKNKAAEIARNAQAYERKLGNGPLLA